MALAVAAGRLLHAPAHRRARGRRRAPVRSAARAYLLFVPRAAEEEKRRARGARASDRRDAVAGRGDGLRRDLRRRVRRPHPAAARQPGGAHPPAGRRASSRLAGPGRGLGARRLRRPGAGAGGAPARDPRVVGGVVCRVHRYSAISTLAQAAGGVTRARGARSRSPARRRGFMPDDEGRALSTRRAGRAGASRRHAGRDRRVVRQVHRLPRRGRRGGRRASLLSRRPPPRHRGEPGRLGALRPGARRRRRRAHRHPAPLAARPSRAAGLEGSRRRPGRATPPPSPRTSRTPLDLLFIDGGHGEAVAWADYAGLVAQVARGRPAADPRRLRRPGRRRAPALRGLPQQARREGLRRGRPAVREPARARRVLGADAAARLAAGRAARGSAPRRKSPDAADDPELSASAASSTAAAVYDVVSSPGKVRAPG